ncbi:MAG: LPP20 family lipoprotein [Ignavibacteriales bacterium]|nr:LPP20 family lipoprotein [Ignavibacteriales bacterium]
MKNILILLVCLSLSAAAQIPQWAQTHTHRDYPPDFFLVGVGSAKGDHAAENAKRAAQTDVASQVRVNLQSQIDRVQKVYTLNSNEQSSEEFKQKSRIVVDEEISSVRIAETALDTKDGTVYALAVLDREDFQRTLSAALDRAWKNVSEVRTQADEFLSSGKLNDALQNLIVARQLAAGIFPKMAQHDAVGKVMYHAEEIVSPQVLTARMAEILSRVRLEKKGGNGQKAKIGRPFPEPLVVAVTVVSPRGTVPVIGLPVLYSSLDGTTLGIQNTDDNGKASFTMTARMLKNSAIRARFNPPALSGEFEANLTASAVEFSYTALPAGSPIAIAVRSVTPASAKKLETTFGAMAAQLGYRIDKRSRFTLQVNVDVATPTAVSSLSGTLYSAMPDVQIVLSDNETGTELAAMKSKGRGVGRSAAEANEKAASDFRVGEQDLASILEKIPE